jgi:trans-2,3-dihydro-3-hydroxyanthranilate isomerase
MANDTFHYVHFDVFTERRFQGNQLAVFPAAMGLSAAAMQAIAREMAFSETTFIFPKEDDRTDARMRIFTPGRELPMAGHPTIGSTFALAHEGVIRAGQPRFVFGLGVGPTIVDLEWRDGELAFAWMTQLRPTFGPVIEDTSNLAAGLGVPAEEIRRTRLPVQEVSCGVPFLFVPIATRRAVDAAELNSEPLQRFARDAGLKDLAIFFFSTEPAQDGATAYSRMFAPSFGVIEDPATGSASGPLGCYLVRHGVVPASQAGKIVSHQGVKMGRPSRIHIAIAVENGEITQVQVGGQAVLVAEGTLLGDR